MMSTYVVILIKSQLIIESNHTPLDHIAYFWHRITHERQRMLKHFVWVLAIY